MAPPGKGELTCADHAHGGSQVWDPYGRFGPQRSSIAKLPQTRLVGEVKKTSLKLTGPLSPVAKDAYLF